MLGALKEGLKPVHYLLWKSWVCFSYILVKHCVPLKTHICEDQSSYRKPDTFQIHVTLIPSHVWIGFCWHKGSNLALARWSYLMTSSRWVQSFISLLPDLQLICSAGNGNNTLIPHAHFLPLVSCLVKFEKFWSNLCALHTGKKRIYIQHKLLDLLLCCIKNTGVQQRIKWGFSPFYHYSTEKQDFKVLKKTDTPAIGQIYAVSFNALWSTGENTRDYSRREEETTKATLFVI